MGKYNKKEGEWGEEQNNPISLNCEHWARLKKKSRPSNWIKYAVNEYLLSVWICLHSQFTIGDLHYALRLFLLFLQSE